MAEISIIRATQAHAIELAENMRAEDRAEVEAMGLSPLHAVEKSIHLSCGDSLTLLINGRVAAIGGVATHGIVTRSGVPWVLTTSLVEKYPKAYYKATVEAMRVLRTKYDYLTNVVDVRYYRALSWLRRLGFKIEEQPVMIREGTFIRVSLQGEV